MKDKAALYVGHKQDTDTSLSIHTAPYLWKMHTYLHRLKFLCAELQSFYATELSKQWNICNDQQ
jgi:hypothetical protein